MSSLHARRPPKLEPKSKRSGGTVGGTLTFKGGGGGRLRRPPINSGGLEVSPTSNSNGSSTSKKKCCTLRRKIETILVLLLLTYLYVKMTAFLDGSTVSNSNASNSNILDEANGDAREQNVFKSFLRANKHIITDSNPAAQVGAG